MSENIQKIRDDILLAALPHVAFDGWSWDVICAAAVEAGHSENVVRGVFPGGLVDVLDHFADWADREMLERLRDLDPDNMRVRDRVREALLIRFEVLNSHKEAVRHSLQFWILPTRKPRAAKITWRTADRIWHWAGDTSEDYNRYTKRGLLSGVIVPSVIFWINDTSNNFQETQAFVDRRIENVMQLGKVMNFFKTRFKSGGR